MRTKYLALAFTLPLSLALAGGAAFVASSPVLAARDGDCGGRPDSSCNDDTVDPASKTTTTKKKNGAGNQRQFDPLGDSFNLKNTNFISAHGQCRWVNNISGQPGLYVPLKLPSEWASFYDTDGGGSAQVLVCCQPVTRAICGENVTFNFMVVGDTTTLKAGSSRVAVYRCAANNNVVKQSETGSCQSSSGGGGGGGSGGGGGVDHDGDGNSSQEGDPNDRDASDGGNSHGGGTSF